MDGEIPPRGNDDMAVSVSGKVGIGFASNTGGGGFW